MAPITFTETSLVEEPIHAQIFAEYKLSNSKEKHLENVNGNKCKVDAYDQRRSTESKFLSSIREWEKRVGFVTPLIWTNIIIITSLHIAAFYWFARLVIFDRKAKWSTVVFAYLMGQVAGFGVTAGAHRYWCHRSYKAKKPLQWILAICFSIAGQNTIFDWVRDHRVHHKFSETDADPHNANRGFFFSHVGWLMMKKHPDVHREGVKVDMSDVINDPVVQIHTKYFTLLKVLLCWVLPSLVPAYCWGEAWEASIASQALIRYITSLNFTWSVNSFAHLWGNKPYDRHIMPSENWGVSLVTMGEGWHNYHHTFPWDYKAAELDIPLNPTTSLLNFFAKIGWAYDMKEASPSLVHAVAKSRGEPQDN